MYRSYLYYYILLLLFYNTAAVALQTNTETASGGQQVRNLKIICNFKSMFYLFARPYIDLPSHNIWDLFPQRCEKSLVYSAVTFTKKKAGKAGRRNAKAAEENCVYTTVRV